MKTRCQFTSLPLEVPFLSSPTLIQFYHPVFTLSLKSLLGIYAQWKDKPSMQDADIVLLTAAFLKGSDHIQFNHAIKITPDLPSRLLQSLESLVHTSILVASIKDSEEVPTFIISAETASLDCLPEWVSLWKQALEDHAQSLSTKKTIAQKASLEKRLAYYILHQKENAIYISLLCEWITQAADLPTEIIIQNPFTKLNQPLSAYWCDLLSRAVKNKEVFSLPLNDIQEFYDHCIENLDDVGSSFAHAALSTLRKVIHAQTQGFGISSTYVIQEQSAEQRSINDATKSLLAAIASKFSTKPERKAFQSQSEYLRASLAWSASQLNKKES